MATTPTTTSVTPQSAAAKPAQPAISTPALISAMVKFNGRVSDLIISPFRPPQVELSGSSWSFPGCQF